MHLSPSCLRWFLALLPSLLWSLVSEVQSRIAIMECSSSTHLQHRTCTLQHCSTAALPWNVAAACS